MQFQQPFSLGYHYRRSRNLQQLHHLCCTPESSQAPKRWEILGFLKIMYINCQSWTYLLKKSVKAATLYRGLLCQVRPTQNVIYWGRGLGGDALSTLFRDIRPLEHIILYKTINIPFPCLSKVCTNDHADFRTFG